MPFFKEALMADSTDQKHVKKSMVFFYLFYI